MTISPGVWRLAIRGAAAAKAPPSQWELLEEELELLLGRGT
ncbi:hypothetical protein [Alienimonas californiensis]|nr:hypothetical protein [Alienimonas californiensis]